MALSKIARPGLLLIVGYSLYKVASSTGYLSAMGAATSNLGFVSQLPFMMADCAAEALAALAIAFLARRGKLKPGRVPVRAGFTVLLLASVASTAMHLAAGNPLVAWGAGATVAPMLLGIAKGVGGTIVSIAWLELIVVHARHNLARVLLGVFALYAALGLVLSVVLSGIAAQLAMLLLYGVSWWCQHALAHTPASMPADTHTRPLRFKSKRGRDLLSALLSLLTCQFVVGIANTAVFQSSFSSIMASVNVSACVLIAVGVLVALRLVTRKTPDPVAVFKVAMPVLLAVFTAAALASDQFGIACGYAMIGCYEAIAIAYTIYMVALLQNGRYAMYPILGFASAAASLTLLAGLAIGVLLNAVCDDHGVPFFTLLAFIAIYPFGLVLLFIQRNRSRDDASPGAGAGETNGDSGQLSGAGETSTLGATAPQTAEPLTRTEVEDYFVARVDAFAQRHGLTRRETEICLQLVRGRTVKAASEALGISENTAWTHIRNVYAKCAVKTKQALIELFESEGV